MNRKGVTIKEALDRASLLLQGRMTAARREAQALLAACLGRSLASLLAHNEEVLAADSLEQYFLWICRRAAGEPYAYITGRREFMGLEFKVNPSVLIPRPDTEVLVETVQTVLAGASPVRLLEVGTGSGAIAISLAHLLPEAQITATDLSATALTLAAENAAHHGVSGQIQFRVGDLFSPVQGEEFDCLVSNPPYIPSAQIAALEPAVRDFEPRGALDGGPDGLSFYRRLTGELSSLKKRPGLLAFEVGLGQEEAVAALCRQAGYKNTCRVKDLAGVFRVVSAVL